MKKFLAMLLTVIMALGCVAFADTVNPDDIPDTVTAADGMYTVAFVTDVGMLKDKSFNQGTWNGVKAFATANNMTYKYYQPANGNEATDDDRYDAMKAAVEGGAKVVVAAGFMQEAALRKAAIEFPEVKFVFIDGYPLMNGETALANVAGISFREEQAGYLAGYAVVRDGFTKLGFSGGGGGTNPACDRYGYGFAQGAEAAAKEMGVNVELKYSWQYGAAFSASPELQTMISGWYETGTEIVFACGGAMFESISAAASANDAFVVGVDVDQSMDEFGNVREYIVTSAMKGIAAAAELASAAAFDGTWENWGGKGTSLGASENAVGLPVETWGLETFTVAEYETMLNAMKDGSLVVDNADLQGDAITKVAFEKVKVIYE